MKDSKASILIVEDEKSVRTSLAEVFTSLGYRTRCAADGLNALIEIRREVPDILLSDLNMPEMSGFDSLPGVFPDLSAADPWHSQRDSRLKLYLLR